VGVPAAAVRREWNPAVQGIPRGPRPVDGEIDRGFTAGVEGMATVVIEDPVFGLMCYGGIVEKIGTALEIVPRDGIRQRLHIITGDRRAHIELECDGFAKDRPVVVDGGTFSFELEQRVPAAHTTRV
jgi:hypothetical protein